MRPGRPWCPPWPAALVLAALASGCDSTTGPLDGGRLAIVSGDGQVGLAARPLPQRLVVRAEDADGRPLAGVLVGWTAADGGRVQADDPRTDDEGLARARWWPGPGIPGGFTAEASAAGAPPTRFQARIVPEAEADVLVARGALGPLRGVVVVVDGPSGLRILQDAVASDSMVRLAPLDRPADVLVLSSGNRPVRRRLAWTAAVDRLEVELPPPVPLDADVRIARGPFEEIAEAARRDLDEAEGVWRANGLGVRWGVVRLVDSVEEGPVAINTRVSDVCGTPESPALAITYLLVIDGGSYNGYGCPPGRAWVAASADPVPRVLAHELGHTFTLPHVEDGLMRPGFPGEAMTDGEIFRAHFDRGSALNVLFDAHPLSLLRDCDADGVPSCLPADYRLGDGG